MVIQYSGTHTVVDYLPQSGSVFGLANFAKSKKIFSFILALNKVKQTTEVK